MASFLTALFLLVAPPSLAGADPTSDPVPDPDRSLLVQTTNSWQVGDRIRVIAQEPHRELLSGWFAGMEGDSVLQVRVSEKEPPVSLSLGRIGGLEERVGVKRHWKTGALVGLAVGLVVGLASAPSHRDELVTIRDFMTVRMDGLRETHIAIAATSGMLLGSAIGLTITSDRWGLVATFD